MINTASAFEFTTSQKIICESGASAKLGAICQPFICQQQGLSKIMLLTDAGIAQLGIHQPVLDSLKSMGIDVIVFEDVMADPPESLVLDVVEQAQGVDGVIGFGGGSSMDVAKLVAFLAHPNCQQSLADIYGVNRAKGARLPLIQVPTTAGTGSEVTQVAIVTTGETTKMGAVSPIFLPDLALLDASLTIGLPPHITAATGVDAMVHAIEAFTSKIKKNPLSDMLAKEALRLMSKHIRTAVQEGSNQEAREGMLLGSMLAGQAFANAPVAAVHALAYPLGGHFHIPHGLSNSLVLPAVLRFNAESARDLYAELAPIILQNDNLKGDTLSLTEQLISGLEALIVDLGLPNTLRQMNIEESMLSTLAEDAMLQTRLLVNNPRDVSYDDALAIYRAVY